MNKPLIIVDYPDPEYSEPEMVAHRTGRFLLTSLLEDEMRPRLGPGHIIFFTLALIGLVSVTIGGVAILGWMLT